MALKTWKQIIFSKKGPIKELYDMIIQVSQGEMEAGSVQTADIAAKAVTLPKIEDVASGKIIVGSVGNRPQAVDMSGHAAIDNTGKVTLNTKTIDVTIPAESASGTVTDTDAINGVILGVIPKTDVDSPPESVALTAESGKIDVVLNAAQGAARPATVTVVVLLAA